MNRLFLICTVAIAVLSCTIGLCSYSQGKSEMPSLTSEGSLYSKYEGDLLSVDIKDVPLEEILRKLSDQTGITFALPPSLTKDRLMVRFSKLTLDEGINKILVPYDRVLIYNDHAQLSHANRLIEVRIYPKENNNKTGGPAEQPIIISSSRETGSNQNPVEETKKESKQVVKTAPRENVVKSVEEWSKDLQEGDETAKVNALYGLARSGGEAAIGPLTSALEDTNPNVRKEAESALTDLYAKMEEENPPSDDPLKPIEGTPRFTIDSSGPISQGGSNQIEVDVRLTDVPEKLITGGFMLNYNSSQMKIVGVDVYDGSSLAGPWDSQMTNKVPSPNNDPNSYMVVVGNLASVAPDENSNINMARVRFECTGSCDSPVSFTPVSGFDTIVGNSSNVYDSKMPQFTIPID